MAKIVDNPIVDQIIGNPTVTPVPPSDWNQTDNTRANYIKNKPLYLTEFFKPVPEGASIDDITEEGCYLVANKNNTISSFSMYYVVKGLVTAREKCVKQFWYQHSGGISKSFSIRQRYLKEGSESWSEWEDLGTTGGGTVTGTTDYNELINTPIKNILIDENIDDVKEVGCYVTFFNDGDSVEYGDSCLILVGTYRDDTYSVDYMPDWYSPSQLRIANNYLDSPKIEYRKWQEGNQKWTDWEDIYATKDYVDSVNTKIKEIIDSAPEALNTLKELSEALNNDPDFAATIINSLEGKVDKVEGKDLSSEDFTTFYKNKLNLLSGAFMEIPEGKTIDDLSNLEDVGAYIQTRGGTDYDGLMLYVCWGNYYSSKYNQSFDVPYQIKYEFTGDDYSVKKRYLGDNGWTAWSNVFATTNQISKINTDLTKIKSDIQTLEDKIDDEDSVDTGYLTSYFKSMPDDKTEDELVEFGTYVVPGDQNNTDAFEFVNDRIISVTLGYRVDPEMGEALVILQTKFIHDGVKHTVKQRYKTFTEYPDTLSDDWTEWEEIYTTKDYVDSENQKLKNEIEETIEKYNIVSTSSGENINITDGSKSSFRGMRVYGKTTQNGSPTYNLEFPLDSVGDGGILNVNIGKKNMVSWSQNGNTNNLGINYIWEKGGSSVVINGTATATQDRHLTLEHQVMAPGVYTASVIGLNSRYTGNDTYDVICVDSGDVIAEDVMTSSPCTFTIEEPTAIKLVVNLHQGSEYKSQTVYFQIEPGKVATEDEPYEQPKTLVVGTPNGLLGIKLDSRSSIKNLANYTDSNGDKWICDVIDFEKGVYIKNIQRTKVNIGGTAELSGVGIGGVYTTQDKLRMPNIGALCEKSTHRISDSTLPFSEGYFYENVSNFVFIGTTSDTIDTLKAKYDGCEIIYVLAEPVETSLSDEQIAAYKETISMYNPTTRYYNSENAGMEIDYVSDTKKYIDAKIDELNGTSSIIVDQEYDPTSSNAQSGKAVSEAIDGSVGDINNALEELIEIQDSIIKGNGYIPPSGNIEVDQEYNPTSSNAQSGIAVAQAIEGIGGSSGGATFFESSTPQIDITITEEVKTLDITEINNFPIADNDFTVLKVVIANNPSNIADKQSSVYVRVNSPSSQNYISSPGTLITATSQSYWGGHIDLAEGLFISGQSVQTSIYGRTSVMFQTCTDASMDEREISSIHVTAINGTLPVGTNIKIWLK